MLGKSSCQGIDDPLIFLEDLHLPSFIISTTLQLLPSFNVLTSPHSRALPSTLDVQFGLFRYRTYKSNDLRLFSV